MYLIFDTNTAWAMMKMSRIFIVRRTTYLLQQGAGSRFSHLPGSNSSASRSHLFKIPNWYHWVAWNQNTSFRKQNKRSVAKNKKKTYNFEIFHLSWLACFCKTPPSGKSQNFLPNITQCNKILRDHHSKFHCTHLSMGCVHERDWSQTSTLLSPDRLGSLWYAVVSAQLAFSLQFFNALDSSILNEKQQPKAFSEINSTNTNCRLYNIWLLHLLTGNFLLISPSGPSHWLSKSIGILTKLGYIGRHFKPISFCKNKQAKVGNCTEAVFQCNIYSNKRTELPRQ